MSGSVRGERSYVPEVRTRGTAPVVASGSQKTGVVAGTSPAEVWQARVLESTLRMAGPSAVVCEA